MNDPITFERIDKAITTLYNDWNKVTEDAKEYIQTVLKKEFDYSAYYSEVKKEEAEAKEILTDFKIEYPGVLKKDNLDTILKSMKEKRDNKTHKTS